MYQYVGVTCCEILGHIINLCMLLFPQYYMYVGVKYAWLAYLLSLQIFKTYVLHKDNYSGSVWLH